jgi:hypothetical protein
MTRYTTNLAAAVAAIFIVVATWTPVVTVPPAHATTLVTPILA